ncbi:hypothetical protein SDJN03_19815, partial [Cucurbita argyrosperma subsp. sororia]
MVEMVAKDLQAVVVVVAGIALVDLRMIAALQELWKSHCKCGTSRLIIHMYLVGAPTSAGLKRSMYQWGRFY